MTKGERMQLVQRTVHTMIVILVTAGVLLLCGCGGGNTVEQATAMDVNNQSFTFADGQVFDPALTNISTTLTFTNNANNFTLSSAGGSATGTNVFGSCILTVTSSTYLSGAGPQVGAVITLSPCDFNSSDNTLSVTNVTNETITAISAPAVTAGTSS